MTTRERELIGALGVGTVNMVLYVYDAAVITLWRVPVLYACGVQGLHS